jgi:NAD(P)-dependent dehydrogenase (short-subunit alcohol dehydrogenase family)
LDLASFSSVSSFADEFDNDHARVDILLANAAVVHWSYIKSAHDWEMTFVFLLVVVKHHGHLWANSFNRIQVNYLSTALLCLRLLPRMLSTAAQYGTRPRLTIVSSENHYWVPMDELISSPNLLHKLSDPEFHSLSEFVHTQVGVKATN